MQVEKSCLTMFKFNIYKLIIEMINRHKFENLFYLKIIIFAFYRYGYIELEIH